VRRGRTIAAGLAALALLVGAGSACRQRTAQAPIEVPEGVDHTEWNRLVGAYVDAQGLVDYARWKASDADRRALADYLAQYAPRARRSAFGTEKSASLVNAYNAFTVSWILDHYPTESIQSLPESFAGERHSIGGRNVSLDEIEHNTLRPAVGFLTHATVVCAARSCPPLAREAYQPDRFTGQISFAMLRWLARDDLNHFDPNTRTAKISSIFKWYREDFDGQKGGLRGVLSLYAPDPARAFVAEPTSRIEYMNYDWGLNDQGPHGRHYGGGWWDRLKSKLGWKK
jgi:hypothetical protein